MLLPGGDSSYFVPITGAGAHEKKRKSLLTIFKQVSFNIVYSYPHVATTMSY